MKQKLTFGGGKVNYAIPVHERTDVKHPIGQAFFLKSAMDEVARTLAAEIAAAMRKA